MIHPTDTLASQPGLHSATPFPAARSRATGFTLIEVLIVVAIIGILAAIAYPSYGEHVRKTRRVDGQFALLSARQALERCRSTAYTYVGCSLAGHTASQDGNYTIALDGTPTASTFVLKATAGGGQANDTTCATMKLDYREKTTPAVCWN